MCGKDEISYMKWNILANSRCGPRHACVVSISPTFHFSVFIQMYFFVYEKSISPQMYKPLPNNKLLIDAWPSSQGLHLWQQKQPSDERPGGPVDVPASTQPQTSCPRTWSAASTTGKHASCSSIAFFPCLLSFRRENTFHCSWSDSTHTHQLHFVIFSDDNIHLFTQTQAPRTHTECCPEHGILCGDYSTTMPSGYQKSLLCLAGGTLGVWMAFFLLLAGKQHCLNYSFSGEVCQAGREGGIVWSGCNEYAYSLTYQVIDHPYD